MYIMHPFKTHFYLFLFLYNSVNSLLSEGKLFNSVLSSAGLITVLSLILVLNKFLIQLIIFTLYHLKPNHMTFNHYFKITIFYSLN